MLNDIQLKIKKKKELKILTAWISRWGTKNGYIALC